MSKLILSQDITINKADHRINIFQIDDTTFRVKCSRELHTWMVDVTYREREINRLVLALQKKNTLKIESEFIDGDNGLKFVVTHPDFDSQDEFILKKQQTDDKIECSLISSRLSVVEQLCERRYPIYRHMLGPAIVPYDIFNDIEKTRKMLEYYCYPKPIVQQNGQNQQTQNTDHPLGNVKDILNYYTIRRVHSKTRPVETENQIVINRSIVINDNISRFASGSMINIARNSSDDIYVSDENDIYTIFTKRYQDPDIVGYIDIKRDYWKMKENKIKSFNPAKILIVDIHLLHRYNIHVVSKNARFNTDAKKEVPLNDFLEKGYILELPSFIVDGIYYTYQNFPHYVDLSSYNRCIVKQSKLYPYEKENMFAQDDGMISLNFYMMKKIASDETLHTGTTICIED